MARGDFPSSKQDQFVLRLPDGWRDRIKVAAEEGGRSMNAEILARLEESFGLNSSGELAKANAKIAALEANFEVLAKQLAGPVGENREEVIRVLSALRILGRPVPE